MRPGSLPEFDTKTGTPRWVGAGVVVGLHVLVGWALVSGLVVLSHWFVDLIVHVPDLTLLGAPPKLGFGLWNHPAVAMPLELGLTYGALIFYLLRTRGVRRSAPLAAGLLALVMLTVQMVNWFGAQPAALDAAMPLTALAAYAVLALLATWTGLTRRNSVSPGG